MPDRDAPLQKAIEACGTSADLAERLGITAQAISQWDRVPPLRVLDVERASGVSRYELRPDIYPLDAPPTAPEAPQEQARAS